MSTNERVDAIGRTTAISRILSLAVPAIVLVSALVAIIAAPNAYSLAALIAAAVTSGGFALFFPRIFAKREKPWFVPFRIFSGYYAALLYFEYALERVAFAAASKLNPVLATILFAGALVLVATAAADWLLISGTEFRDFIGVPREEKGKKKHGFWFQVFDTIHAFIQAALIVIVINIFVFQIFQVPSESMVSSFMINDRPLVLKFTNGPKVPISDIKLPSLRSPRRGDVVVFRNPRYPRTEQSEFKRFCSQLVYMVTFSLVNLDKYNADGETKADPLVKRVVGVPGEKIMMIDDKVYVKGKGEASFRQLTEDAERWSQVDVEALSAAALAKVRAVPITAEARIVLKKWDGKKAAETLDSLGTSLDKGWADFAAAASGSRGAAARAVFERSILPDFYPDHASTLKQRRIDLVTYGNKNIFQDVRIYGDELLYLYDAISNPEAMGELKSYVLGWKTAPVPADDPYAENTRKASLFFKRNLLSLFARDLELVAANTTVQKILLDPKRNELIGEKKELIEYLFPYYDMRNFPITPAARDEYITPNHYFVMGDNRYNSLDFRYASDYRPAPFDTTDPWSLYYLTNLDPKAIDGDNIEGIAVVRLWPFTRFGSISHAKQ
jgi:signal peptidase I